MSTVETQKSELSPAEHLRYLRDKAGVTQKELAAMIGVHHRTIANYEGGRAIPRAKWEEIVDALKSHEDGVNTTRARQEVFVIKVKDRVVFRVSIVTEQDLSAGTTLELGV